MSDSATRRLGQLVRVNQIRDVWPGEASHFTPWLCRPENLAILSEALGMGADELEFEASEHSVGAFYADIICRDTLDGGRVLIENQFGASDHDHLGKLLTYASGLDARTVVLIGEHIREEHRAALDWLNDITGEGHDFFACELELWRIGDSLPAPRFNVVVRPNDWAREVQDNMTGEPSELRMTYRRYWEGLNEVLAAAASGVPQRKPHHESWLNYPIGKSDATISIVLGSGHLRIGLYLSGTKAKASFDHLEAQASRFESDFGAALNWDRMPDRQTSRVVISLDDADPLDESDWPRQHEWLAEQLRNFQRVFRAAVQELD